jgi:hypothetical protein
MATGVNRAVSSVCRRLINALPARSGLLRKLVLKRKLGSRISSTVVLMACLQGGASFGDGPGGIPAPGQAPGGQKAVASCWPDMSLLARALIQSLSVTMTKPIFAMSRVRGGSTKELGTRLFDRFRPSEPTFYPPSISIAARRPLAARTRRKPIGRVPLALAELVALHRIRPNDLIEPRRPTIEADASR